MHDEVAIIIIIFFFIVIIAISATTIITINIIIITIIAIIAINSKDKSVRRRFWTVSSPKSPSSWSPSPSPTWSPSSSPLASFKECGDRVMTRLWAAAAAGGANKNHHHHHHHNWRQIIIVIIIIVGLISLTINLTILTGAKSDSKRFPQLSTYQYGNRPFFQKSL